MLLALGNGQFLSCPAHNLATVRTRISRVNNNNNNNNSNNKEVKLQEFMYRDTTNVEPEMYDYTSNNWSHWNSNEKRKEKFGSCTKENIR